MEEIITKIIDIDKEAVEMEENSKILIEEKQKNLREYFKNIENGEQKKAEERIQKEKNRIKEENEKKIKELELKKENKINNIETIYEDNKDRIMKDSVNKILQL